MFGALQHLHQCQKFHPRYNEGFKINNLICKTKTMDWTDIERVCEEFPISPSEEESRKLYEN